MEKAKSRTKKVKQGNRQVSQYDKVLKENIEAALPGLIKNLLGIDALHTEELPDDVQHTKERKPDVLKKMTDKTGETFVLHVELQVKDEPEMVYRMAEYYIMLLRRYELPVRQYVIYMGKDSPTMTAHLHSEQMDFKYQLIALIDVDYRLLLRSDNPEEKILAILGNFGGRNEGAVVESIMNQVVAASKGDFSRLKCEQQLRILAPLRNFRLETLETMDSVANYITKEKDILYRLGEKKGIEQGIEKGAEEVVKNLLLKTDFSMAKIASLANVTEAFVRRVKKTLN